MAQKKCSRLGIVSSEEIPFTSRGGCFWVLGILVVVGRGKGRYRKEDGTFAGGGRAPVVSEREEIDDGEMMMMLQQHFNSQLQIW